jgi:hypothetical protein
MPGCCLQARLPAPGGTALWYYQPTPCVHCKRAAAACPCAAAPLRCPPQSYTVTQGIQASKTRGAKCSAFQQNSWPAYRRAAAGILGIPEAEVQGSCYCDPNTKLRFRIVITGSRLSSLADATLLASNFNNKVTNEEFKALLPTSTPHQPTGAAGSCVRDSASAVRSGTCPITTSGKC